MKDNDEFTAITTIDFKRNKKNKENKETKEGNEGKPVK
jgi:hypothetical protein